MAGLFARIFKQWAEEAVVNKLADSPAFQRAAVGAVKTAQEAQRLAESAAKDPSQVTAGISAFWSALKAEAAKDLGGGAGAGGAGAGAAAPPAPVDDAFARLSSRALKEELARRGASSAGLLEKSELLAAVRAAAARDDAAAGAKGARRAEEMS